MSPRSRAISTARDAYGRPSPAPPARAAVHAAHTRQTGSSSRSASSIASAASTAPRSWSPAISAATAVSAATMKRSESVSTGNLLRTTRQGDDRLVIAGIERQGGCLEQDLERQRRTLAERRRLLQRGDPVLEPAVSPLDGSADKQQSRALSSIRERQRAAEQGDGRDPPVPPHTRPRLRGRDALRARARCRSAPPRAQTRSPPRRDPRAPAIAAPMPPEQRQSSHRQSSVALAWCHTARSACCSARSASASAA